MAISKIITHKNGNPGKKSDKPGKFFTLQISKNNRYGKSVMCSFEQKGGTVSGAAPGTFMLNRGNATVNNGS